MEIENRYKVIYFKKGFVEVEKIKSLQIVN